MKSILVIAAHPDDETLGWGGTMARLAREGKAKPDCSGGLPMAVMSISDVINHLTANKQKYCDLYGITRIGVFGSFVRDEQTPFSDIDLVVEMDPRRKNLHNYLQFKRDLEKTLQLPVDVGFEHTLKPIAKESMQRQIVYA